MAKPPYKITVDSSIFERAAKKLLRELPGISKQRIAFAIMLEWVRRIVLRWPVLTGRSRAAWSIAAEVLGFIVPAGPDATAVDEGRAQGRFEDMSSSGRIVLRAVNAVVYAPPLEDGTSNQAPAGAVAISLAEILQGKIPEKAFQVIAKRWAQFGLVATQENARRAQKVS